MRTAPAVGGQPSGSPNSFNCTVPNWGALYPVEPIQVFLYRGNRPLSYTDGTPFALYIEEEIYNTSETVLDAAGVTITVNGSGFRSAPGTYQCFLFGPDPGPGPAPPPPTAWPRWTPQQPSTPTGDIGFPGLAGAPFVVDGLGSGSCRVEWPYEATPAFFTLVRSSPVLDALQARIIHAYIYI
jgi:hypothetical protein